MTEPPNRRRLASILRVIAAPEHPPIGPYGKRHLLDYINIAEDTIEQQAAAMRTDAEDLAERALIRRDQSEIIHSLGRQVDRLRIEVATLRQLADAALIAGARRNDADLNYVRQQLEMTR